ncbi:MAG: hypothetical protein RI909_575 [Bacteroidota bacterium]|jgi:hypothetical protein
MKVYAVVCSVDYEGSSEPEGIYASEARADAIAAELQAHAGRNYEYTVFEYEVLE